MNMKRIYFLLLSLPFLMASCIKDDSTMGTDRASISISGVESSYNITTFNNELLEITPTVTSSFGDDDLAYSWSYFDTNEALLTHPNGYEATFLSADKNLKEDIGFRDGTYTFLFTVTSKSTGYSQTVSTQVYASSVLSQGFCILKENADGNTDMDMYNTKMNTLIENMFATYQGSALNGKPRAMDVLFGQAYMDRSTDKPTGGNLICVTTYGNEVKWVDLQGFKTVMDASTCHYTQVTGEVPYRTVQGDQSVYYLTSSGIYSSYTASHNVSGIFGTMSGNGGSTHVVAVPSKRHTMLYWNETTRSICLCDINGQDRKVESELEGYPVTNTNMDCLASGVNKADGELVYFLLKDRTNGNTYLYYIDAGYTRATLSAVEKVKADSHLANGTSFTVNNNSAKVIYSLKDNKVYAYELKNNGTEREISLAGIPADEQLTYISNRYFLGTTPFNYFVAATQKGNTYKVYLYNMLGENTVGAPQQVITGTGIFKSFNYIDPLVDDQQAALRVPLLDN